MLLDDVDTIGLIMFKSLTKSKKTEAFNTVFRRIFRVSRFTSMRLIYNFIGTKILIDYLYYQDLVN